MNSEKKSGKDWMAAVESMADKGYLFVHINKTGGTSVREALGVSGYQHVRAADIVNALGALEWARLTTFSTIRNPWDRLVSMYHWRIKTNQTGLADSDIAFHDWLDLCLQKQDPFFIKNPLMLAPQTYWLCDEEGMLLVDTLLRFEQLSSDFKTLCTRLGLGPVPLPHLKQTERRHYSVYFSEQDVELVKRVYATDIDMFGYRFETEPA